jgi:steroid 5-alpha reductase family enzyme
MFSVPPLIFVLLAAALIVSAIGFYRTVLFISVGYAFSITAMTVITVIAYNTSLNWVSLLQNILLFLWSVRLGVYLIRREVLPSFSGQRQRNAEQSAQATRKDQFLIWISVSMLYVAMFSPSLFRLASPIEPMPMATIAQLLGLVIMAGGLILEAVADQQKSNFKAKFPKSFCNVGLYRWMRCPNYLGEILFWLGNWVITVPFYASALQWVLSFVGLVCIVLIMLGSTKRLERSQGERYGSLPEYQDYISTVPVLLPFIPIYTLKNIRVYLE